MTPDAAPSSQTFLRAWANAIALVGPQYFGDGTREGLRRATDKNQLRPRWDDIERAFPMMSSSQQDLLAHMLPFFNTSVAGWPIAKYLRTIPNPALAAAVAGFDANRREALANLILTYEGW